uniref:Uncharacterized protein n=1 Tax=Lepeophtheirus salmonis TaxID=72036 RepID=A0A0K2T131_LEPSM
MRIIYKKIYI